MMIKVLFVTEEYPPVRGGIGTSAQRVARGLALLGYQITVVTFDNQKDLSQPDYIITERDESVLIHRVGPFFLKHSELDPQAIDEIGQATFRRRVFDQMLRLAQEFSPHIVMSFSVVNSGLLGVYIARSLAVPHLASMRGNDISQGIFTIKAVAALNVILSGSKRVTCVNEHLRKRAMLAFPNFANRFHVITNSVNLPSLTVASRLTYLKTHTRWPADAVIATFIGSLREKKGVVHLLKALCLANEKADVRLLVVGPDVNIGELHTCENLWNNMISQEKIHIVGHMERSIALSIAAEAQLVLMPSIDDGLPNGLLEGMAIGLCPIVSSLFRDIVTDQLEGWVYKTGSEESLARCLIEASYAPQKRRSFAKAAKKKVLTSFNPKRETLAYKEQLELLVRSPSNESFPN